MNTIVTQFGGWLGLLAAFVFGIFSVFGVFNKESKKIKKEEVETASTVITLLKEQVNVLTLKVDKQDTDIKELTFSLQKLKVENSTLLEVLQGKDNQTQQFYKDVYVAIEIIKHDSKIIEDINRHVNKLVVLLETKVKKTVRG